MAIILNTIIPSTEATALTSRDLNDHASATKTLKALHQEGTVAWKEV